MRQKLLSTAAAALLALPLAAKSGITVECGNLSVVRDASITANIVFDYSNLEIEGKPYMEHLKSRGSDFVRDWPEESAKSEDYFIRCWNKDNDEGMQVGRSEGSKYTMVIVANEMDMGSGAASMFVGMGAGGAKMSGMMHIFEGDNNVPVLTASIDNQSGRSAVSEIARRMDLYGELAEDMVDALNDAKQSSLQASTKAVTIPSLKLTAAANAQTATQQAPATAPQSAPTTAVPEFLLNAQGKDIPRRRIPVVGNFDNIARQNEIGVYIDFSDATIMNRSERSFIRYMKTSAGSRDVDPNFDSSWENDIKPEMVNTFCARVNEAMKDEDLSLRFDHGIDFDYVVSMKFAEMDDDGNNTINFLFVNMKTGKVEAQIKCESSGGHVGRYIGLIMQGMESAGENFAELLIDKID